MRLDTGQWKLLRTGIAVDQPWPGQWWCLRFSFFAGDMVGYCWAWCLVRQWIHGLRQLLGAIG